MLIDTHCHLDAAEFDPDRAAVVQAARDCGVGMLVMPAVRRADFDRVVALAGRYPGCVCALGIHPLYTADAVPDDLRALERLLGVADVVAVGEIGLDFFVADYDQVCQERFFIAQLELARAFDLPVLLHVRRAVDAVLKQLRRIRPRGGIAHAFNGSEQQAHAFIDLGFKLGFGGAMTYERALRIRHLAATLPLDAIVLETDAPDMAPQWLGHHGRNSPDQLPRIAATLAAMRGLEPARIAAATTQNARDALPLLATYAHQLK